MKIDIDSYDCVLLERFLSEVDATIIVVEYNAHFPPPIRFARLPSEKPDFMGYFRSDSFGCSIAYAVDLLASHGFGLLRISDSDLLFMRTAFFERLGQQIVNPVDCYREVMLRSHGLIPVEYVREWFFSLDRDTAVERVWANLTSIQQDTGHFGPPVFRFGSFFWLRSRGIFV